MPVAGGSGYVPGGGGKPKSPPHVVGHHFTPAPYHPPPPPYHPPYHPPPPPAYHPPPPPPHNYSPGPTGHYGGPPHHNAPQSRPKGGGGGGNNGGGGGGGGNQHGGGKPHKPKPPSIQKYLKSDDQYQNDRAGLIKNFRNLMATNEENRSNVGIDKKTTLQRLGHDQAQQEQAMIDDFAARGLYGGAEFLNKKQDFDLNFLNQENDARTSARRNIQQLLRDLANAKTLKDENLQQSRLEAIRRRAAEFGIK